MIFELQPVGFSPQFELVQCYLECESQFLLLKRLPSKPEGGKWGTPAGKVEKGEQLAQAMIRELEEETQIKVSDRELSLLGNVCVRYPDYDFKSHIFFTSLSSMPSVRISPREHSHFKWATFEDALKLNLVLDQDKSFQIFSKLRVKAVQL